MTPPPLHNTGILCGSPLILEAWPEQSQSAGIGGNPTEQVSLSPEAASLLTLEAIALGFHSSTAVRYNRREF